MILQALAEFSRAQGLVQDPAFEYAGVSWAIDVGPEGHFYELFDLREESPPKKKKPLPRQMLVPKRSKRTVQPHPEFLVDKAEYVFGLGLGDPKDPRLEIRRLLFQNLITSTATATELPAAKAVSAFLSNEGERLRCIEEIQKRGFISNDLFCFRVEGEFLQNLEPVKEEWRRRFFEGGKGEEQQCLLCGRFTAIVRLHPNIKGLSGASTSGVPMVSFNQSAFWSYGWENNANSPVCAPCADAYASALNRCLSGRFPDPTDEGTILPRQAYTLGENLSAVYWSDDPGSGIEIAVDKAITDPQQAKSLLESPWKAQGVTRQPLRFHCLLLEGAQGRATVKSYLAEPIQEIRKNLQDWFAQIEIGTDKPIFLARILSALTIQGKASRLPNTLSGDLYLAILFGRQIPRIAVQFAVVRNRVESKVPPARAALLQAWLHRKFSSERKPLVSLNPDYPSTGYQLGRLLAVCEYVQYRKSSGSPNKTVVDRYFPALSTRPKFVFSTLIKLTELHLSQLRRKSDTAYFQSSISEILGRIAPSELPTQLSLEEQANFALGFYHQRQDRFTKKNALENSESEEVSQS